MDKSLSKFALILLAALAACNVEKQEPANTQAAPGSATGDPAIVHHPEPPARPASKPDSILMEGTYLRFTARLVQPISSVEFSTYLPHDMIFENSASAEGEGFFFYTNFAGKRNDNAFLLVFILPRGSQRSDADRIAETFESSRAALGMNVDVKVGQHGDRFYYVAQQYPAEYAEGFLPRSLYIRDRWVWLDDGQGLLSTSQPRRE